MDYGEISTARGASRPRRRARARFMLRVRASLDGCAVANRDQRSGHRANNNTRTRCGDANGDQRPGHRTNRNVRACCGDSDDETHRTANSRTQPPTHGAG
ncbi:MAG: hypothetical protein HY261_11525 [Chloroflexi bacterium]|nr:hypothetical protein [Chloroflexota bacterium]